MSNVIKVEFGTERYWQQTEQALLGSLLEFGKRCGDDEALLRLKADRAMKLLREMSSGKFQVRLPPEIQSDLTPAQREVVARAIEEAAQLACEQTRGFCMHAGAEAMTELCTSVLGQ